MLQWAFITALTLVSALALALVYGVGGVLSLNGQLEAGLASSRRRCCRHAMARLPGSRAPGWT